MKAVLVALTLLSPSAFAETYKVDSNASRIEWKAGKKVGSFHNGGINVKGGEVETDDNGALKKLNVIVDMKTISNEDLKDSPEYQTKLVQHLSSEDFFNVSKYPESRFEMTNFAFKKGSTSEAVIKGKFTMNGQTHPVSFPATVSKEGNTIKGKGSLKIERLKWNLRYGSGSIFKSLTADKIINDTFDLTFDLVGTK